MVSVRHVISVVAAVAGAWSAGATGYALAEPVTFTKDAPLRADASPNAAPVTQVKQGTVGDATTKKGPWLNITVPGATGWALTTDISFGAGAGTGTGGGASLGSLFGGRRPQAASTSTIGIRGFDKETIGNALGEGGAVSDAQLNLLDRYAVSKEDGQSFASSKGLSATNLGY